LFVYAGGKGREQDPNYPLDVQHFVLFLYGNYYWLKISFLEVEQRLIVPSTNREFEDSRGDDVVGVDSTHLIEPVRLVASNRVVRVVQTVTPILYGDYYWLKISFLD
jgi:hypothetical protein